MVKEAEAHAAEDQSRREEIDARNQAEWQSHQAEQAAKNRDAAPAAPAKDAEVVDGEFAETL
jgi:molecular chaperone DnaK